MAKEVVYEYTLRFQDGMFYDRIFRSILEVIDIRDRYSDIGGPRIVKRPVRDQDWEDE